MKEYFAKSPKGDYGIYLSADSQMDAHLTAGENIYEVENGKETLIATPEDGFLTERPVFPARETMRVGL